MTSFVGISGNICPTWWQNQVCAYFIVRYCFLQVSSQNLQLSWLTLDADFSSSYNRSTKRETVLHIIKTPKVLHTSVSVAILLFLLLLINEMACIKYVSRYATNYSHSYLGENSKCRRGRGQQGLDILH